VAAARFPGVFYADITVARERKPDVAAVPPAGAGICIIPPYLDWMARVLRLKNSEFLEEVVLLIQIAFGVVGPFNTQAVHVTEPIVPWFDIL